MDENRTNRDLIMKLACMISYVLRRWKVVLLIVLIGAMGFDTVRTLMYHPRYQASVSATLGAEENTYSQLETTRAYIRSLDYIFNGQNVQSYLQERLGREDADLTCSVNSVNDTNLVNISVQADTRRDAWFGLQYVLDWYRTNGDKYHFNYDLNVTQTNPISEAPVSANSHVRNFMMGGIGGGIEKVCSVGMPALFIILLICIIRACTLPGAVDGLKYMFVPGWALENGVIKKAPDFLSVLSTAGGQMFFSLSLGMGAMITYGSYLHKKENIEKNALLIVIMDTLVALMAGLCVIPGRFALDPTGALGGPSLLFVTMQNVFHKMPLGALFGILFYLLVVFAAISSSISLLEVIVAHFCDKARDAGKGDKRKTYSLIAAVFVGLGCILICMDSLGGAGISPFNILGMDPENLPMWSDCWLDFFDCISEGILMPLGALLMCLCIGWELGPKMVDDECCLEGQSFKMKGFFNICVKFITPLCMILVLYGQIKEFFF